MSSKSTIDLLSQLISFDTTSRNSNLELIDWVQSLLDSKNVSSRITFSEDRKKANLFATLGDSTAPGIVLSGHTDVVPVDGQDWSSNPFSAEVREDRLYGRGSCDMKGFIAICLSKIEEILEANLSVPIHFAFSYDEEVGCIGVNHLIADLKNNSIQPKACIIGEPTSMKVIRAHKGMLFKRCNVHGKSAHSSLVDGGVNAVTMAARTLCYIDDMAEKIKQEGPFDDEFVPPYTTLHCGVIKGGTANNIIPSECQFDFEIRNLPGEDALQIFNQVQNYTDNELTPIMKSVDAGAGFEWRTLATYPGMDTPHDERLIQDVSHLLGLNEKPGKVSYGTEGGLFQKAGIATIICGPGSIEQAHKPDEYVDLDQLAEGERFLSNLIGSLD